MKIILASSNKGKIKEIQKLLPQYEVLPYSDILGSIDIEETGSTFKENSIIKAVTVNTLLKDKLKNNSYIIISDDSGITVPALNNEPNIYSARYAGENATDEDNLNQLISNLNKKNISKTAAHYTACLTIILNDAVYTVHGWMYGEVINKAIGSNGFGYDPIFIPTNFDKTLGELDDSLKKEISHRSKALNLALKIINSITK